MKLSTAFLAFGCGYAVTVHKNNANNFLSRNRRANEGYFSELSSGNLERECIEEDCNMSEFHEVYDDRKVSDPLYTKYLDCKNYIKSSSSTFKSELRACFADKPIEDNKPVIPPKVVPLPAEPPVNSFPECNYSPNEDSYLCYSTLPNNGFADVKDPLFLHLKKTLNASSLNRSHCKLKSSPRQDMVGGSNRHECKLYYESAQGHCSTEVYVETCVGCAQLYPKYGLITTKCN